MTPNRTDRSLEVLHPSSAAQANCPTNASRSWRNAALFGLAFAAMLLLLRGTLPERGGLHTDAKFAAFEADKDSIDLIFLGSSRTYRGFAPEVFEAELAARGHTLRAFNFGVMGNRATESLELLKRIAHLKPQRLRWVLVDPEPLEMLVDERQERSRRVIDWHDAQATADVARLVLKSERPWPEKAQLLWRQWVPFAYHELNVGAAQPLLNSWLGRGFDPAQQAEFLGARGDGFRAMQENLIERADLGEPYALTLIEQFPKRVAQLSARRAQTPLPGPPLAPERAIFLERIEEQAARLGAQTIFVVQPTVLPREELLQAAAQGLIAELFDYGNPSVHPELYTLESRYDVAHASETGAQAFTRALARDFADKLEAAAEPEASEQ